MENEEDEDQGGGTDHALGKQIRCFTKKNYYGVYPKLSLN